MTESPESHAPPDAGAPDVIPRLPRKWGQYRLTFRNRILAGLLFLVPLVITFLVARWLYSLGLEWSPGFLRRIYGGEPGQALPPGIPPWTVPLLKFCVFVVTLLIIGALLWIVGSLSSTYLTKMMLRWTERVVFSIPLVRSVYTFSKQVMDLIAKKQASEKSQRVVLVEFPHEGFYAVAFASGETKLSDRGEEYISVFLPTTPNPTSGFMLLYPIHRVLSTRLTFEEGIQAIMSGGIVLPEALGAEPFTHLPPSPSQPETATPPHA